MSYPTEQLAAIFKGATGVPPFFNGDRYELTVRRMNYASGMRPQIIHANSLDVFVEYKSEESFWEDWEKVD